MGFLFSGVFWGSVLILLGISVIVKIVFNIHIPLFRIVFALVLVYLGVRVLVGGSWCTNKMKGNSVFFTDAKVELNQDSHEYNIIFGKGRINLTDPRTLDKNKKIEVNTVFGACEVKINPDVPMIINVSSAFAGAKLPDGNIVSFGEYVYKTKSYADSSSSAIRVDASVVFGGLEIIDK